MKPKPLRGKAEGWHGKYVYCRAKVDASTSSSRASNLQGGGKDLIIVQVHRLVELAST
jgi:hypothetical protein